MVGVSDSIAGELPVAVIKGGDVGISVIELQCRVARNLDHIYMPQKILDLQRDLHMDDFPPTSSGKIRKSSLKALICRYLATAYGKEPNAAGAADDRISLEQTRKEHWTHLTGLDLNAVSLTTSVTTFADSITIMRSCAVVSKELGRTISMADIKNTVPFRRRLSSSDPQTGSNHQAVPGIWR